MLGWESKLEKFNLKLLIRNIILKLFINEQNILRKKLIDENLVKKYANSWSVH